MNGPPDGFAKYKNELQRGWQGGKVILGCCKGGSDRLSNLRFRKSNVDSVLAWNSGPALTLAGLLWGSSSLHVFVELENAYDHVPRGVLWGVLQEYGVPGSFYKPAGPCITKVRAVSVCLAQSQTCFQWVLASARVVPYC